MEQKSAFLNSQSAPKRVHYAENTVETEKNNLLDSTAENYSGTSEISRTSIKYSGDANSDISIATSILDVEDTLNLKKNVEELNFKIKFLESENNKLNEDLLNEKRKSAKLDKKLQFVKDNQEVFMRLKEAYINMKYNEAAGRKMIEIREKSVQTWEGTLCGSCIESEELRRQIDVMIQKYSELFVVSPGEMEHLMNTVKYLKDLISRREESWAFNMEREHKLKSQISLLENENNKLKEAIANCSNNKEVIDNVKLESKLLEERKIEEMQKFVECLTKDLEKLKKIIIKYEKRFREVKEHYPGKYHSPLNDKETKLVQQIIIKYNEKVQKKNVDEQLRCQSPSRPQTRRPSSPLRSVPINSSQRTKSPARPLTPKCGQQRNNSAFMMMDYLFD